MTFIDMVGAVIVGMFLFCIMIACVGGIITGIEMLEQWWTNEND